MKLTPAQLAAFRAQVERRRHWLERVVKRLREREMWEDDQPLAAAVRACQAMEQLELEVIRAQVNPHGMLRREDGQKDVGRA